MNKNAVRSGILLSAALLAGGVVTQVRGVSAQAAPVNVQGTWVTQFAGAAAAVTFTQANQNVVGIYVNTPPLMPGSMAGVMQGNVLTGRWTDARSSGGFTLTFTPDGRSFTGTWGRSVDSPSSGGPWLGRRQ